MQTERNNDWETKRKQLEQEYPNLTNEDLAYEIGKEKELLERLQKKMSKNKKEIWKWLSIMGQPAGERRNKVRFCVTTMQLIKCEE